MIVEERNVFLVVIAIAVIYRTFWGIVTTTTFVPDEYFQSTEPAYNLVHSNSDFGVRETWEWQAEYRIRSFVLLVPYILFFQLRIMLGYFKVLLPSILLLKGPRLVQALMTSYSDILYYCLLEKITSSYHTAAVILLVHMLSWSGSYCLSRTLANSSETALVIIGTYFWYKKTHPDSISHDTIPVGNSDSDINCPNSNSNPDPNPSPNPSPKPSPNSSPSPNSNRSPNSSPSPSPSPNPNPNTVIKNAKIKITSKTAIITEEHSASHLFSSLFFPIAIVVLTIHSRPTAVLFWAPFILIHTLNHPTPLKFIFFGCIPTGVIVFSLCILFDSYCYKQLTITPYNFFTINISHNYAELYYGIKPFHWNFTEGLPVMLGLYSPFLLYSLVFTLQPKEAIKLELLAFSYIILLSCITAHQEYRFLLPCLPFLHISIGYTIWDILRYCAPSWFYESNPNSNPNPNPNSKPSWFYENISSSPTTRSHSIFSLCISPFYNLNWNKDVVELEKRNPDPNPNKFNKDNDSNYNNNNMRPNIVLSDEKKQSSKHHKKAFAVFFSVSLLMVIHFSVALYLSTRHQQGTERSFSYLGHFINKELKEVPTPSSSNRGLGIGLGYPNPNPNTNPNTITVILLAPCHAFPGPSLLSLPTHRKIRQVSLDCSPIPLKDLKITKYRNKNVDSVSHNPNHNPNSKEFDADNRTCDEKDRDTNIQLNMTESKRFEASPSNFIDTKNKFWVEWGEEADFILTFNSYFEELWPVLQTRGFQQLTNLTHADFRYDYDDPLFHQSVVVLFRDRR